MTLSLVVLVLRVGRFDSGPVGRGCRAYMIDFFAFHLTAASCFSPAWFFPGLYRCGFRWMLQT